MLEDPDRKVRGFAAQALLDRGFGKPTQPVEADGAQCVQLLHLVAAREVGEQIERAMAARNGASRPVIEGEPVPQAQPQQQFTLQHRSDDEPPNLCEPALE
jgi:hypothetical protein